MSFKKTMLVGLIATLCGSANQINAQSPTQVKGRAERVARARWEPTRQISTMQEPIPESLPGPQPHSVITPGRGTTIFDEPEPLYGHEPMYHEESGYPSHGGSCGDGSCGNGSCGSGGCNSLACDAMGCCGDGCDGCDGCGHGGGAGMPRLALYIPVPTDGWFQADALLWWLRPMHVPPLVTTSPANTAQTAAGVLGRTGTTTLVGGQMLDQMYSGSRFRVGFWTDRCQGRAVEAEFFGVGEESDVRTFSGTGNPIFARPFFNTLTDVQDSELVSFPNEVSGTVGVDARSKLGGIGIHWMQTACCSCDSGRSLLDCCCRQQRTRLSGFMGYRWLSLREDLGITENLTSTRTADPGSFAINDHFRTRNQFNGLDFGMMWDRQRGRWSLDMLMKLAIGGTHQEVDINGSTVISNAGASNGTYQGGLLAQRTNIGSYSRNRFSAIPELGANLGYQLNPFWKARVGYTFLYWTSVVRPGDQIDTQINPNLLPIEAVPFSGALRPEFRFNETNLWVNGLNIGLEFNW